MGNCDYANGELRLRGWGIGVGGQCGVMLDRVGFWGTATAVACWRRGSQRKWQVPCRPRAPHHRGGGAAVPPPNIAKPAHNRSHPGASPLSPLCVNRSSPLSAYLCGCSQSRPRQQQLSPTMRITFPLSAICGCSKNLPPINYVNSTRGLLRTTASSTSKYSQRLTSNIDATMLEGKTSVLVLRSRTFAL
jgi:hypothetical protein